MGFIVGRVHVLNDPHAVQGDEGVPIMPELELRVRLLLREIGFQL
jgi:hypothetical protein